MQKTHAQQQTSPQDTPTHPLFVFDLKTVCLCPCLTHIFIFFLNTFSSAVVWAADFHLSLSKIYEVEQHWSVLRTPCLPGQGAQRSDTWTAHALAWGSCSVFVLNTLETPYHQGFSYPGGDMFLNLSWGWSKWPQLFCSLGELPLLPLLWQEVEEDQVFSNLKKKIKKK